MCQQPPCTEIPPPTICKKKKKEKKAEAHFSRGGKIQHCMNALFFSAYLEGTETSCREFTMLGRLDKDHKSYSQSQRTQQYLFLIGDGRVGTRLLGLSGAERSPDPPQGLSARPSFTPQQRMGREVGCGRRPQSSGGDIQPERRSQIDGQFRWYRDLIRGRVRV